MNTLPHLPDNPGPDHSPLTFKDHSPGVTRIYWGENRIGDTLPTANAGSASSSFGGTGRSVP